MVPWQKALALKTPSMAAAMRPPNSVAAPAGESSDLIFARRQRTASTSFAGCSVGMASLPMWVPHPLRAVLEQLVRLTTKADETG